MPLYYKLGNPGISSISVAGRTHHVKDGLLEVPDDAVSHTLTQEITGHFGGRQHKPDDEANAAMAADEEERQVLFSRLDVIFNRKIDRRRSVGQLREMLADHMARHPEVDPAEHDDAAS